MRNTESQYKGNNTETPLYSCVFCLKCVDQSLKHLSVEKAGWAAMKKPDLFGMTERRRDDEDDEGSRNRQRAERGIRWRAD